MALRRVADIKVKMTPASEGKLEWIDQRTVVVKAFLKDTVAHGLEAVVSDTLASAMSPTATVFRFDPAHNGHVPKTDQINLDAWLGDLAIVDVETGAIRRTCQGKRIWRYALSPDATFLACVAVIGYERPGSQQLLADLLVFNVRTGGVRRLLTAAPIIGVGYPNVLMSWAPTSRAIAVQTTGVAGKRYQVQVVALDGAESSKVIAETTELPGWGDRPLWDHAGRLVYFVRGGELWRAAPDHAPTRISRSGKHIRLIEKGSGQLWSTDAGRKAVVFISDPWTKDMGLGKIDLTSGSITNLSLENKKYGGSAGIMLPVVASGGSMAVYLAEDSCKPQNLWAADVKTHLRIRQVTDWGRLLRRNCCSLSKIITWRSLDGDTLKGAIVYPCGDRPGTGYPLIVKVYGGMEMSDLINHFGHGLASVENLHLLLSRGYAILLPDSKLDVGTPVADLVKAILPGVEKAVDLGIADARRVGIMGHSYGGYSTLALITESRRFRAAVVRGGYGDLIGIYSQLSEDGSNYGVAWAESGQGRMGGTPWAFPEHYLANSPFLRLNRVQTPLLIIHGSKDQAVASHLSDQIFVGLRRLAKTVEYARYNGEGHWEGFWSAANQLDYLNRVLAWFERYLRDPRIPQSTQ